jgi:hypothetical protein
LLLKQDGAAGATSLGPQAFNDPVTNVILILIFGALAIIQSRALRERQETNKLLQAILDVLLIKK